jgi:cell fate regulator YaaT (PSP1 superfamily)
MGDLKQGQRCIVRTERGTEIGEVVAQPTEIKGAESEDGLGEVLRQATREDLRREHQIETVEKPKEFKLCEKKISELELPMKLIDVEHLFGGERIVFYFRAEKRVDFRQLVRDLAQNYKTRIEMRQIGVRDEARLLGYFEHCGRTLCCRTFITNLEPVTMKMAKSQKATLDPAKISGRCGRLMCCLRFEDKIYEEMKKELPTKGTWVLTGKGDGIVTELDIIRQLVTVELAQDHFVTVHISEIIRKGAAASPKDETKDE